MGLLTGTSWDISNKSADISALRAHGSTSLDVNKATGMLTSNAKGIFCDSVICFGTNSCCSNRSRLPECFIKAPHFLLARVQLSTCFPISLLHIPCNFPLSVLHPALKKFCSNKRALLAGTSWDFFNIPSDISALWAHGSTSLDVNMANGMLTSNAKGIFCDSVTCFGTNSCCSNRSHLPGCFNASHFLLTRLQL